MDVFDVLDPLVAQRLRDSAVGPFAQAYWDRLCEQGYAPSTVRVYVNCLSHFAWWAARRRFELAELEDHVGRFVDQHLPRCRCAGRVQRVRHTVRAALEHLKTVVVTAGVQLKTAPPSPADEQLRRFDQYLDRMKGLSANTRLRRLVLVRPLATMMADAALPTADQLRQFLRQELSRISTGSVGATTTAVRSYLRFRGFEGEDVARLLPLVGSPPTWRLAPQPETLTASEVQRLLDAFPPGLPSRLRGYAIVRCLVDLGLRTSEVTSLELDHIDWAAGTVRICKAKSRRVDLLPLPQATGTAIAEYIRSERPPTTSRRIFVRHVAPVDEPAGTDVVRRTVREAYRRAALPHTRIHILRHTLARRLLNTGGTLKEVADVLRHRELDTSLIYAKVDFVRLGAVAMPWPGSMA